MPSGSAPGSTDAARQMRDKVRKPRGKMRGARDRLSATFLDSLQAYWYRNGEDVFDEARAADPVAFTKIVADLIPKISHVTGRVEAAAPDVNTGLSATGAFLDYVARVEEGSELEAGAEDDGPAQSVLFDPVPPGTRGH